MKSAWPIRIALVEDHQLVRAGLRSLLASEPGFELVGEATDGFAAIQLVENLQPKVLLLDLRLPRLHGLEVIRRIRGFSQTRVVVVSMHSDQPYVAEALRGGVSGYVLKECPPSELIQAINVAGAGGNYICEALRHKTLSSHLLPSAPGPQLTRREFLVLQLAAEGKPSAEIAKTLFISRRTVEAHRANLMKKLALKTQTDLVLYAVRNNMISP